MLFRAAQSLWALHHQGVDTSSQTVAEYALLLEQAIVSRGSARSRIELAGTQSRTAPEPLSHAELESHCRGGLTRYGALPFTTDTEVGWACIDLDFRNWGIEPDDAEALDLVVRLVRMLEDRGVRAAAERSKGKGWHIWVVFSSATKAKLVRLVLSHAALECGAHKEADLVCPRQDVRTGTGNGTWLPLYGGDRDPSTRFHDIDADDDLVIAENQAAILRRMIDDPTPPEAIVAWAQELVGAVEKKSSADDWGDCAWIRDDLRDLGIELHGARYLVGTPGRPGKIQFGCPFHEAEEMRPRGGSAVIWADGGRGSCASAKCGTKWPDFSSFAQRLKGGGAPIAKAKIVHLTRASDVNPQRVQWLWQPYIPSGKMTLLEGEGGVGKTTLACDLIARVTTGREESPDGAHRFGDGKPHCVIFASAEDDLADTLRPRLEAAGADLDRVHFWTDTTELTGEPRDPEVPADLDALEAFIREHDVRLVFFDPIFSFLGDVKTSNDKEVRQALRPVRNLCERTGVAVLSVRHWNKRVDLGAAMRGGDSVAFTNASRSVLACVPHPNEDVSASADHFLVFIGKSNLAPRNTPPVAYMIEATAVANGIPTTRVKWVGVDLDANLTELKKGAKPGPPPEKRKKAEEWVRELMADEKARTLEMLGEELEQDPRADFSLRTLQRVLKDLVGAGQLRRCTGLHSKVWWTVLMERDEGVQNRGDALTPDVEDPA